MMIPAVQSSRLIIVFVVIGFFNQSAVIMLIITGLVPIDKEPKPAETFCMATTYKPR